MAPNNTNNGMNWEQLVTPCGKEQETSNSKEKDPESYNSQLGTYSAAVTPLCVLCLGLACGTYSYWDFELDPRMKGWFLMENPVGMFAIAVTYILFSVVWGPRWRKGKKPLQLKEFMIFYNGCQVIFSLYMFIETGVTGWFFDYSYRCQPCDFSLSDKAVRMTRVCHWYFLSKILDFVDTFLFVMRGKLNQVTMLHVIHHSCMFMSMWRGIHYTPGGHITFMGFLNTFVHTVMYSYYLLAALGPRVRPYLWWKKYLTKLQLTQFVAIFLHAAQLLVFPCEGVPTSLVLWTLLYAFIFFALFINFYVKAYLFGARKTKTAAVKTTTSNGAITNGSCNSSPSSSNDDSKQYTNGNIASFMKDRTKHRMTYSGTMAR